MQTKASVDGASNILVTTSIDTTGVIDLTSMRDALIRSDLPITVTPYISRSRSGPFKAVVISDGSIYPMELVDEWQPLGIDVAQCHYLKLVGSSAAPIEIMAKA